MTEVVGEDLERASATSVQRQPVVQRLEDVSVPISEVAAGEVPADAGTSTPATAEVEIGEGGVVVDSNLSHIVQRQAAPQGGSVVVQRMSRQDEISLSLTSPGRAVMEPSRPSLSLFNFGIDHPEPKGFHTALLAEFSQFLQREVTASTRTRVVGHADPTGAGPHNQTLSANRAAAVAAVLQSRGSAADIFAEGDTHPVASNNTVDGRSRNRRVDILVSATGPPPSPDPRPRKPDKPNRNFCDRYPVLCGISPPGLPFSP